MQPCALFRCDATPAIGAGHVTRCLALAEALAETGWRVAFAIRPGTASMVSELALGSFGLHELSGPAEDEPRALRVHYPNGVDLFVIDHYQRDVQFEQACRGWARKVLVMDDATSRLHDCDFLVDAAATDHSVYGERVPASAHLLLGPAYALVRRRFVAQRAEALRRRDGRAVKNILVSFGATDPLNLTSAALDALAPYADELSTTIALSSSAPHLEAVRPKLRGQMQLQLDADMAALISEADLAIGAAGASAFERAVLGLPSIVVTSAKNQRGVATLLKGVGAAIDAGPPDEALTLRLAVNVRTLIDDPSGCMRMTEASSALVDGRGWQRLLIELVGKIRTRDGANVRLRLAEKSDENWLLELQRMPQTRRYARNPEVPTAQEHAEWMAGKLADPGTFFLVIEIDAGPVGFVRLDRLNSDLADANFEVSVAVCPKFHGRGIGSAALVLARRLNPAAVFDAEILPDNTASQALFVHAGYQRVGATRYRQQVAPS